MMGEPLADQAGAVSDPYAAACRAVTELLASLPRPLSRLRISHEDVVVEIEWWDSWELAVPMAATRAAPGGEDITSDAKSATRRSADAGTAYIRAATVGTFYHSPRPGTPPFVSEGDTVQPGMQVAVLESMKMMVPVEADCTGEVVKVLVPNGGAVEYGERLIEVALAF